KKITSAGMACHVLNRIPVVAWLVIGALAAALTVPTLGSPYFLRLATLVLIFTILVIGLNLFTGYTGPLSLLHLALFGVGAYTSALLRTELGWSFLGATLAAIVLAVVVATVMGSIALVIVDRLIFSVVTIGLAEIVHL